MNEDTLIDRRAVEIHAERREVFHFGPPPYSLEVVVEHQSGPSWRVQLSDHIPPASMDPLFKMVASVAEAGDPETMAFALAWVAASTEVIGATVALRPKVATC